MRLLFVTSSFPESRDDGVCGYVYDLALRLSEDFGHDARVLAPGNSSSRDAEFDPVRVERYDHPWRGTRALGPTSDIGAAIGVSARARMEAVTFSASLMARTATAAPLGL